MFGKVVSGVAWLFFFAGLTVGAVHLLGFETMVISMLTLILLNSFAEPSKRKG